MWYDKVIREVHSSRQTTSPLGSLYYPSLKRIVEYEYRRGAPRLSTSTKKNSNNGARARARTRTRTQSAGRYSRSKTSAQASHYCVHGFVWYSEPIGSGQTGRAIGSCSHGDAEHEIPKRVFLCHGVIRVRARGVYCSAASEEIITFGCASRIRSITAAEIAVRDRFSFRRDRNLRISWSAGSDASVIRVPSSCNSFQ
jgi:hypothetical protein